jgi:hypothetical protein
MNVRLFCNRKLHAAFHLAVIAACFLIACTIAHAEDRCPWMNEATASDLVGADVTGTFAGGPGESHSCTFTERSGREERKLQITVEDTSKAHAEYLTSLKQLCHSEMQPLRGIGNEAVTCSILHRKIVTGERALGRVRNEVFMISLDTSVRNDPILTPAMLVMKIEAATEQVTGSLF